MNQFLRHLSRRQLSPLTLRKLTKTVFFLTDIKTQNLRSEKWILYFENSKIFLNLFSSSTQIAKSKSEFAGKI